LDWGDIFIDFKASKANPMNVKMIKKLLGVKQSGLSGSFSNVDLSKI